MSKIRDQKLSLWVWTQPNYLVNVPEHLLDGQGYNARLLRRPTHGVSLPTACLPISKHCAWIHSQQKVVKPRTLNPSCRQFHLDFSNEIHLASRIIWWCTRVRRVVTHGRNQIKIKHCKHMPTKTHHWTLAQLMQWCLVYGLHIFATLTTQHQILYLQPQLHTQAAFINNWHTYLGTTCLLICIPMSTSQRYSCQTHLKSHSGTHRRTSQWTFTCHMSHVTFNPVWIVSVYQMCTTGPELQLPKNCREKSNLAQASMGSLSLLQPC